MTPDEAREIAAPDSWPWPMSEEAKRWVALVMELDGPDGDFSKEAHERFMKSLG